jgi:hypothetical protein
MTPLTWQPIESAPENMAVLAGEILDGQIRWAQTAILREGVWHLHDFMFALDDVWVARLTHWMPLPSPPMERTPGADSAVDPVVGAPHSPSTRDESSSLRAMYVEEADHLAAIDLTDQIAHLREQAELIGSAAQPRHDDPDIAKLTCTPDRHIWIFGVRCLCGRHWAAPPDTF